MASPAESTVFNRMNNYRLANGKFLVEGARRAALYDTISGNVYSLNQEAAEVIKGRDNNQEFWLRLTLMGLVPTQQTPKSPPRINYYRNRNS